MTIFYVLDLERDEIVSQTRNRSVAWERADELDSGTVAEGLDDE